MAFSIISVANALEYEKGAGASDIHPRLLRKLLIQGKTTHNGSTIVIKTGVKIPSKYQKKWDEIKLSGGDIPQFGPIGPKVILITSF